MKTRNTIFALAIAMALNLLASCEIETSDNGHLDGLWHLEQVDTLSTGGSADYSKRYIFWGTQYKLMYVYDYENSGIGTYSLRFSQTSDSLHITKVYLNHWHEDSGMGGQGGDIPVETVNDSIRHFGINELPEGFAKEKLTGSNMILRSKTLRLKFKKF